MRKNISIIHKTTKKIKLSFSQLKLIDTDFNVFEKNLIE